VFTRQVLERLERESGALKTVDLGAGNGWLSYRLSQRGHVAIAVDLLHDPLDGLGALRKYTCQVKALVAHFDRLPLAEASVDLAIFNASLHYSTDYATTVKEGMRVLRPRGTLVILDSPMYSKAHSGERMVREREARFLRRYGFASSALPSQHYLTPDRLDSIADHVGIRWQIYAPALDARTRITRAFGGLRARREPARFPVIVGIRE
jgi:ubiquinone/menaquinone biosynthesis C-methylase UbiE